jgi:hypothetical protein
VGSIFINYRRNDSQTYANSLYDWLSEQYGDDNVFKDVETIEPGLRWEEAIDRAVGAADVMLVVIGPRWLADSDGRRRIDEPRDFVRREIEKALERNIRVIPVLVGGAKEPSAEELPEPLRDLIEYQSFTLNDERMRADRFELLRRLDRIVGRDGGPQEARAEPVVAAPAPAPAVAAPPPAPTAPAPTAEKEDRSGSASTWGWVLTGVSVLIPFAAIAAVVFGGLVISRSNGRRTGTGVAIIIAAIVVGFLSFSFWAAATGA